MPGMAESVLWTVVLGWPVVGAIVVLLIGQAGIGVLSMNPPQYTIAQISFALAGLILVLRTGWWLAFEQAPNVKSTHIIIFAFIAFGLIGILCVQSVRWINGLREKSLQPTGVNLSGQTSPQAPVEEKPTLLSLFKKDFPNVMKLTDDAIGIEWKDHTVLPIKRQMYLDFPARTKFVGFYIPPSSQFVPSENSRTFAACMRLVESVQKTIDDLQTQVAISAGYRGEMNTTQDLTFSRRVLLYHGDFLSIPQKAAIIKAYARKRFDVQFRGPDYLGDQIIAWHHQHDVKGAH